MEICLNTVASRFIRYTDFSKQFAIFEIGRVATGELEALEKVYTHQLQPIAGDPTNGTLQKKLHPMNSLYTVRICLFVGHILDGNDLIEIEKKSETSKVTITYTSANMRPTLKAIKHISLVRDNSSWFMRFPVDWDKCDDDSSSEVKEEDAMDFSKESVNTSFIGQKISFDDKAPKKWVNLYTLLYYHFAHWCNRVDATLRQRAFSYSNRSWYPAGIDFYIMKRNSSDGKDKLKFSVFYDELTEQVTMRFFAENIDIIVDGQTIHESSYCEPIISAFLFDKPTDGVKSFDTTNGDKDNKMENDWRPLDVLKAYFGDTFWDNIIEIFGKFIPKQTAVFDGIMVNMWNTNTEYQFFNFIRHEFSRFATEWFLTGSVKQIIKSINSVDWEVTVMDSNLLAETNSFRRYHIELRHRIGVKDSNGISDDNLAFYKIDPIYGPRRIIPYGLDHEFGNGFSSYVESIYNSVRMKIKEFVKEEKKMTNDEKKELDEITKALTEFREVLKQEVHEEKTDPKYPHFSTDKNGTRLVTMPLDVYHTMVNTQYGMAVTVVKDRRTEIKDAYWNPKTGVATIIWTDGTKTMSKPMEGTTPDPEIGFAICIAKKMMGGTQNKWRKWLKNTIDASAASAKKKGDKSLVKLEKQARARLLKEKIDSPDSMQLEALIETIKAENAAASEKNKPEQKKPGRKKKTN